MAHFYIYETVTFPITFTPEGVLQEYKHIVVSLSQGVTIVNKTENELTIDADNDRIDVSFSQEETANFVEGEAIMQVNIYYENTERDVSTQAPIEVRDNIYRQVIEE